MTSSPNINPLRYFLPEEQPRPSLAQALSPLKRPSTSRRSVSDVVQQDLFSVKRQKVDENREIKVLNPMSQEFLTQLPPLLNLQIQALEHSMSSRNLSEFDKFPIRTKMYQILHRQDILENDQLVELGILYYYSATGRITPSATEPTLLVNRLQAIEDEIDGLKSSHQPNASSMLMPSGITAYLLRVFVRMIFPCDGGFNLGGCHAVHALLNTRLHAHLSEEMRDQILAVIDKLLTDESFRDLFKEPFNLNPQMHHFICLDLKISFSESMNFVYIRWSILMALFSVIGQSGEGNCYAVATTMNLLRQEMTAVVELLIQCLQKGTFFFGNQEVPITPLMENRRKYGSDLDVQLDTDQVRSSTPYEVAISALDHQIGNQPRSLSETKSLGDWFEEDFNYTASTAKEFFLSHKQNFLQQMLLAVVQFIELNTLQRNALNEMSARKECFVKIFNKMFGSIFESISIPEVDQEQYKSTSLFFMDVMFAHLYLIDYTHAAFQEVDGKIIFTFHNQGFIREGQLEGYRPFLDTRRLFRLDNGQWAPIDKLTDFSQHCLHMLKRQHIPDHPIKQRCLNDWTRYLNSETCLKELAQSVASLNKYECNFSWEKYLRSNSFFIIQSGGGISPLSSGINCHDGKFSDVRSIQATNAQEYFIHLCESVRALAQIPQQRESMDPYILVQSNNHLFNITPIRFEEYWENSLQQVTERLIQRGQKLSLKGVSRLQMIHALLPLLGKEMTQKVMRDIYKEIKMSIEDFRNDVKSRLEADNHTVFDRQLQKTLKEVNISSLVENLSDILQVLNERLLPEDFERLKFDMVLDEELEDLWLSPFNAAQFIQRKLSVYIPNHFIAIQELEQAICKVFELPEVIEIGNLNWTKVLSERLKFTYLILRFDLLSGQVVLATRRDGVEYASKDSFLQELIQTSRLLIDQPSDEMSEASS